MPVILLEQPITQPLYTDMSIPLLRNCASLCLANCVYSTSLVCLVARSDNNCCRFGILEPFERIETFSRSALLHLETDNFVIDAAALSLVEDGIADTVLTTSLVAP